MEPKILVIDDAEFDLTDFVRTLHEHGFKNVFSSRSAEEGKQMTLEHQPDIVVLDIVLQESNGYQLCNEIKNAIKGYDPYVIMITGNIEGIDVVAAADCKANRLLPKKKGNQNLIDAINERLGIFPQE